MAKKIYGGQSLLEKQYAEIIRGVPDFGLSTNSAALLEQPENVIGQNFTTYSAGEIPAFLNLKQL
jgi:hypothetical protein